MVQAETGRSWGPAFNLASPGPLPLAYHVSTFFQRGHARQKYAKILSASALSRATIWQPSVMEQWHIWDTFLSNHPGPYCKLSFGFGKIPYQVRVWRCFQRERGNKSQRAPAPDLSVMIKPDAPFWIACAMAKRCLMQRQGGLWEIRGDTDLVLFTCQKEGTSAERS